MFWSLSDGYISAILYLSETIRANFVWLAVPVMVSTTLSADLEGLSEMYGVNEVSLNKSEDTVEIDTVVIRGKSVKIYAPAVYHPDHYKLHKKFLISYYSGEKESAAFFAGQLQVKGPSEMRLYYAMMVAKLTK